jgi:hypothetical protein
MRSAKAAEARAGLGALEKDAASKGFLLIARRGHPVSAPREGFPPPQLRGFGRSSAQTPSSRSQQSTGQSSPQNTSGVTCRKFC